MAAEAVAKVGHDNDLALLDRFPPAALGLDGERFGGEAQPVRHTGATRGLEDLAVAKKHVDTAGDPAGRVDDARGDGVERGLERLVDGNVGRDLGECGTLAGAPFRRLEEAQVLERERGL